MLKVTADKLILGAPRLEIVIFAMHFIPCTRRSLGTSKKPHTVFFGSDAVQNCLDKVSRVRDRRHDISTKIDFCCSEYRYKLIAL